MESSIHPGSFSSASVPPPPQSLGPIRPVVPARPAPRSQPVLLWCIVATLLLAGIAYFSHMLLGGYRHAAGLVSTLHTQMVERDWDGIYSAAAPAYTANLTDEANRQLFASIDRKLGVPVSTRQQSLNINSTTSGTTLSATFQTTFSQDATATEFIVWRYLDGHYRLESYNIHSPDLILR
jgi:hypothetical protein